MIKNVTKIFVEMESGLGIKYEQVDQQSQIIDLNINLKDHLTIQAGTVLFAYKNNSLEWSMLQDFT